MPRLLHVTDDTVRDDEEDEILRGCLLLRGLGCKPGHMVDDRREIGGTVEADVGQASRICLGDAVHTRAEGVGGVEVDGKLMGDLPVWG